MTKKNPFSKNIYLIYSFVSGEGMIYFSAYLPQIEKKKSGIILQVFKPS